MSDIKEVQDEVKNGWDAAFDNPLKKSEYMGSDPKSAFDSNGVFDTDNWNDRRMSLFRRFFGGFFGAGPIHNDVAYIGRLTIGHLWKDDENFVFIIGVTNDLYCVNWYKSRGRTDTFFHNGNPITLDSFKLLIEEMMNGDVTEIE